MIQKSYFCLVAVVCVLSASAFANPDCLDRNGSPLDFNNDQVVEWKSSTPNQFTARAHVEGTVTKIYNSHSGHTHFQATIGDDRDSTIELVFNDNFGTRLSVHVGQTVEACGDYITSTKVTQYPISPDHGIMHWLHENPRHRGHKDGFLVLDGQLYGVGDGRHRH